MDAASVSFTGWCVCIIVVYNKPMKTTTLDNNVYAFSIRVPVAMRDEILRLARLHRRSLNQEVVALLEQALALPEPAPGDAPPAG